ncbi:MAG: hypothetical protein HYU80_02810 [Candidatus Blackburnbacteria bacterium]|nr:hypothetical protein [Candidatus Blackburnbacteria bacterium]
MATKIGRVLHYYDKIGVAVVELAENLSVGEKIRFARGGEDLFDQSVSSMQSEHEEIETAKSGEIVGLKVDQPVKEGAEVLKEE